MSQKKVIPQIHSQTPPPPNVLKQDGDSKNAQKEKGKG